MEGIWTTIAMAAAVPTITRAVLEAIQRRQGSDDPDERLRGVLESPGIDAATVKIVKKVLAEGRASAFLQELSKR